MLNLAEMAQFDVDDGRRSSSRYETAREAQISQFACPESANRAISALSAAQRGPWGPHRPIVRAGAAACGVELAAARALSASARVYRNNARFSARVLGGTRPESRQTKATTRSSVVELTKRVPRPGSADRPGTLQLVGRQDLPTLGKRA